MTTELSTSIDNDAPPEPVWQVLTDLDAYPQWNRFMTRAKEAVVGARLSLTLHPVDARRITLGPTVLEATPGRQLRWLGVSGVFEGEHSFTRNQAIKHRAERTLEIRPR